MKLILMRGVSGSGKSTLAKQLANQHPNAVIYSTDDFFMVEGQYQFDPKMIGHNHAKNQARTKRAMQQQTPCIIVDNTNTQAWEMRPYVEAAHHHGYTVEIHQPEPVDLETIMERQAQRADTNKALPIEIVQRMMDRFEHNVTIESIMNSKSPF